MFRTFETFPAFTVVQSDKNDKSNTSPEVRKETVLRDTYIGSGPN
jgi:hypothetical protein